jgi:hypothetical protein
MPAMAGQTDNQLSRWPLWRRVLLAVLLVFCAVLRLTSVADDAAYRFGLYGEITTVGGAFAPDPAAPTGFMRVASIVPGGALAKAGLQVGDAIHTKPTYGMILRHPAGTRIDYVRERGGVRTAGELIVAPARLSAAERQGNFWLSLNMLSAFVTTLIGCFILWRGWGNITAMLLGAGMFVLNPVGLNVPMLFSGPVTSLIFLILYIGSLQIGFVLPLFAMRLYEESVGKLPQWHWRFVRGFIAFGLAHFIVQIWAGLTLTVFPFWMTGNLVGYIIVQIVYLSCLGYLVSAWIRSQGAARNRNAVILFAFLAYVVGAILGIAILGESPTVANRTAVGSIAIFNAVLTGLLGPSLLAYAVLRHKLFDIGFAINRTLVFATISSVLLASFGLLEWAAEHLVPEEWHEGGAFFSAVIAVGLFLLFHRIRDAVEHAIERLFFRKWQRNEAVLKRFVAAAAHIEKPDALAANFTAELTRFAGGAPAALFARSMDGQYQCAAGTPLDPNASIDADDPALAAMRAEKEAIVPGEVHSGISASLALPMMHQTVLVGFALLYPKPSGEYYRPDEVENLSWATQQVGMDLQAIRVRELELLNIKLVERNKTLADIVQRAALASA